MSNGEFDWATLDNEEIVTRGVRRTAVYRNKDGDLVIRQERDWNEDEDPFLVLPVEHAKTLVARLSALIKEAEEG